MIFYVLQNQIVALFLSMNLLTTLSFDSEVLGFFHGVSESDLSIKLTNKQRTLVIQAKREGIASNLLVVTREGKFYFNFSVDEKNPHQFIEVKQGQINHAMKLLKTYPEFEIWEGSTSLMLVNRSKNMIEANGIKIKDKEYFSKGTPLFVGGVRLLY